MRLTVIAAAVSVALLGISTADEAQAAIRKLTNIPEQSLDPALRLLAKDRKVQLLYASELVRDERTNGAAGDLTLEEALTQLLIGTRLTYRYLDEKAITIVPLASVPRPAQKTDGANTTDGRKGSEQPKTPTGKRSFWDRFRLAEADGQHSSVATAAAAESGSSNEKVEEIVVTAQKRQERLQDVPVPVTALNAQTLVDKGQLRLQDYYASVPGLNFSMDNRGAPTLSIRGITTGAFVTPTIGFTVDDVPYGSAVALSSFSPAPDIDPNELSRVEVLRGPQGTLYGANSIGGLIKYVTIDPATDAVNGRVQLGTHAIRHGSGEGYNVSGAINVPLSDTFAIRASGFSRQDPGYIDNVLTGQKDVNDAQVDGARLSALWRTSDAFALRLSALAQRGQADGASQVHPGVGDWEQQYLGNLGGYDRKVQAYGANVSARVGQAELTSITGYNIGRSEDSYDVSSGLGTFTQLFYGVGGVAWTDADNETKNFSQEFRLALPLSDRIDWLLGAFYTDQRTDLDGGFVLVDPTTFVRGQQVSRQRIASSYEEYALFTDVTFRITERFDIQVGGRQSRNRQSSTNVTTGTPPLFGDSLTVLDEFTDNVFTYLVTPRVRLSPDLMLYARLASGYRPGGSNVAAAGIPASFSPDRTQNYELGAKGDFLDGRLSLDASVYHIIWREIQISQAQSAPPFLGYTDNGSRARSRGIELSIEGRPWEKTSASLWTVWNQSELSEALPAASTFPGSVGDRLPYSTRFSGTFSLEQTFPLGRMTGLVAGSANYVGRRAGEFSAPRQVYPSYTRVDLRAGVRSGSWNANLFVNNVGDERGELSGGAGIFPFSFTYIQPRTVGLNLSHSF